MIAYLEQFGKFSRQLDQELSADRIMATFVGGGDIGCEPVVRVLLPVVVMPEVGTVGAVPDERRVDIDDRHIGIVFGVQ